MYTRIFIFIGAILFSTSICYAQNIVIIGYVLDAETNLPIGQVDISVDGGKGACTSDDDGKFQLVLSKDVNKGETIRIKANKNWDGYSIYDVSHSAAPEIPLTIRLKKYKNDEEIKLQYSTQSIKNKEFLFTSGKWDFETNAKGEDIISDYTSSYKREQIVPLNSFQSTEATIANNEMAIQFIVQNNHASPLYIDDIFIQVTDKYEIDHQSMYYNAWLGTIEPHEYEVTLSETKNVFDFPLDDKLIEVSPDNPEFFKVIVKIDPQSADLVYEFKIFLTVKNSLGQKFELESDRQYHLGAMRRTKVSETTTDPNRTSRFNTDQENSKIEDSVAHEIANTLSGASSFSYDAGKVVNDPEVEKIAFSAISSISSDIGGMQNNFSPMVYIGPALWKELKKYERSDSLGLNVTAISPSGEQMHYGLSLNENLPHLLTSQVLQYLSSKVSNCAPRAATESERELFYQFINWEIKGKPVTILDCDDLRLLIYLDENKRIHWIDIYDYFDSNDKESLVTYGSYSVHYRTPEELSTLEQILDYDGLEPNIENKQFRGDNYELNYQEFSDDMIYMTRDNVYLGVDYLVKDNPIKTQIVFLKAYSYDKKVRSIKSGSLIWELLCKTAIYYQNHHHDNSLIRLLSGFSAFQKGGQYLLNKLYYEHEELHGSENGGVNMRSWKFYFGDKGHTPISDYVKKVLDPNLKFLRESELQEATQAYEKGIAKIIRSYGSSQQRTVSLRDSTKFWSGGEFELHLFLYALLLRFDEDTQASSAYLAYGLSRGMYFARLLFYNLEALNDNKEQIISYMQKLPSSSEQYIFDDFIFQLTGNRYAVFVNDFNEFLSKIKDEDYDEAFVKSENLLVQMERLKPDFLSTDSFKYSIRTFRASYFMEQNKLEKAKTELLQVEDGDKILPYMLTAPDHLISKNSATLYDSYIEVFMKGFKNGYWYKDLFLTN